MKKAAVLCLLAIALLQAPPVTAESNAAAPGAQPDFWEQPRYLEYMEQYAGAELSAPDILLSGRDLSALSEADGTLEAYEGKTGALVKSGESGYMEFAFDAPADALYQMEFSYYTVPGKKQKIERALYIDGKTPYQESASVLLDRVFRDEVKDKRDGADNQIRSNQAEVRGWYKQYVYDATGSGGAPLLFYFAKGRHTLRLEAVAEPMVLEQIRLCAPGGLLSYRDYISQFSNADYKSPREPVKIQAEDIFEKSDQSLYPSYDRQSAATEPYAAGKIRLNILSGEKFRRPNQWVSYKIRVETAGLYRLSFKVKQPYKDGGFSVRQIIVNGSVPFKEAESCMFTYSNRWQSVVPAGSGGEFYFYFKAGENELTLRSSVGPMSDVLNRTQQLLDELNLVYRRIFMITGSTPDPFRDYNFKKAVPDEIAILRNSAGKLGDLKDGIIAVTGETGSYLSSFDRLLLDVEQMAKDPESISKRMKNYKTNLGALADWVTAAQLQPLDMDYIELLPKGAAPQKASAGFFRDLLHQARLFFSSFLASYDATGGAGADAGGGIKVWAVTGGLDQAQLVKQLVDDRFIAEHGVNVRVQLVPSSLLPSTLAGIGPDVALFAGNNEPMNYAVRGASKDLAKLPGFGEVKLRFEQESMVPYTFMGGTYALPETTSWSMLFYRKDIFKELSLGIPRTWDDVYDVIVKLQGKNLSFAMPPDAGAYYMFLYQNGGRLYNNDGETTAIDTVEGIAAFNRWTEFFSSYKLEVEYNFVNRFRTGEMPAGIADFTTANQLKVFAPEIRGLWGMAPIPATVREDGSQNRESACTGTADMILARTKYPDEAWEFLQWWTSDETQSFYAEQLESLLGASARYATANKRAFAEQAWTAQEKQMLTQQRGYVRGIPEVPGSYITPRYIDFAFKAVVNDGREAGKELLDYSKTINAELARKRAEFAELLKR